MRCGNPIPHSFICTYLPMLCVWHLTGRMNQSAVSTEFVSAQGKARHLLKNNLHSFVTKTDEPPIYLCTPTLSRVHVDEHICCKASPPQMDCCVVWELWMVADNVCKTKIVALPWCWASNNPAWRLSSRKASTYSRLHPARDGRRWRRQPKGCPGTTYRMCYLCPMF